MKNAFIIAAYLFMIGCSQINNSVEDSLKHLDLEIKQRIDKINVDIESRITKRDHAYLHPNSIHDSISGFISLYNTSDPNVIAIRVDNFFNKTTKYYDVLNINFLPLFGSQGNFELNIKLNELTLLDHILLDGNNKLTQTSYQGICARSFESDTMMRFDIALIKIDTIRTPTTRIKSSRLKGDSIFVPIVNGVARVEFIDDFKHNDLEFTTFIDCRINNKDTSIITKINRQRRK